MKDLKASYEAARDVLDATQDARNVTQEHISKAEKAIGAFRGKLTKTLANNLTELQAIREEARGVARQVADNKMPLGKARQALAGLQARQAKVLSEIGECDRLTGKLQHAVHAGGEFNKGVTQVSEIVQELKLCKGNLGKVLIRAGRRVQLCRPASDGSEQYREERQA